MGEGRGRAGRARRRGFLPRPVWRAGEGVILGGVPLSRRNCRVRPMRRRDDHQERGEGARRNRSGETVMSVSDAYRDAVNKMRAARGMGPAFHRASDPEARISSTRATMTTTNRRPSKRPPTLSGGLVAVAGLTRASTTSRPRQRDRSRGLSSTALQGREAKSPSPPDFRRLRNLISAP